MNKPLSIYTKIAAYILLGLGVLEVLFLLLEIFLVTTERLEVDLRRMVMLTEVVITAVYHVVIGIFLLKKRRWTYLVCVSFTIVSLIFSVLAASYIGMIPLLFLVPLLYGRKDFAKNNAQ